jgi:hypothetical protein
MAGGTGSGLGCALIENIRHHFCCHGKIMDEEHESQQLQYNINNRKSYVVTSVIQALRAH